MLKYTNQELYRYNDIYSTSLHLLFSIIIHILSLILIVMGKQILLIQGMLVLSFKRSWLCMGEIPMYDHDLRWGDSHLVPVPHGYLKSQRRGVCNYHYNSFLFVHFLALPYISTSSFNSCFFLLPSGQLISLNTTTCHDFSVQRWTRLSLANTLSLIFFTILYLILYQ